MILIFVIYPTAPVVVKLWEDDRFLPDIIDYPPTLGKLYFQKNNLIFGDTVALMSEYLLKTKYLSSKEKISSKGVLSAKNKGENLVVLILGESSLSTRYSAYGYGIDTTPGFARMKSDPGNCMPHRIHSASPITRDSLAMTLSFALPENMNPLFSEKSIIDYAKDAGYRTAWIGSQPLQGLHETKYGFLAKKSDAIFFTNGKDEKLLSNLEIFQNENHLQKKQFIILHMAGNHMSYMDRFDAIDAEALPQAHAYDKSIRKTDRIVAEIVRRLDTLNNSYSLLFVSDHGEIVGIGHGISRGGIDQYLIPMFIRQKKTAANYCDYIETLRNKNGYISALSNKFVLLHMLGYGIDEIFIKNEIDNDRVLHSTGKVVPWINIEKNLD